MAESNNEVALMPNRIPGFLHKLFSVPELAAASDYCLNSEISGVSSQDSRSVC